MGQAKRKQALAAVLPSNVHILGQAKPRLVAPLHDWHTLKELPAPTVVNGVAIPESQRVAECEIIASGPGRINALGQVEPMVGKVGQRVLFEGQAKPFRVDGATVYAVRDVQLVGTVERNPEDVEAAS